MENIVDKDQFQYWLMDMDDAISRFIKCAPIDISKKLDLTPQSILVLEAYVLGKYGTPAETLEKTESKFIDGAARYFGEILRKHTNANWSINLDNEDFVFYGLPIVLGGKTQAAPVCPLTSITSSTDRRTGQHLLKIFNAMGGKL